MSGMRGIATTALAAALVSGLVGACSSPSGFAASNTTISSAAMGCSSAKVQATSGSGDPLAKLTADEIVKQAQQDAYAAGSWCMSEPFQLPGTSLKVTSVVAFTPGSSERCEGMITTPGGGVGTLTLLGKKIWVKANPAYARNVKGSTPGTVSARTGKYVTTPHSLGTFGPILTTCNDARTMLIDMTSFGPFYLLPGTTMIDGQPAVKIADETSDYWYISDTAKPLPLRVVVTEADNEAGNFSNFGAKFTMSPPAASQVVDGSKYGF